jgi:predicted RNA polymerase sigma factor
MIRPMSMMGPALRSAIAATAMTGAFAVAAADLIWPPPAAPDNPSMVALDRIGRQIARDRCRKPVVADAAPASGATVQSSETTWACKGYRLRVAATGRKGGSGPRLIGVDLQASHPALPAEIAIGAEVKTVIDALGAPDYLRGDDLIYPLDGGSGDDASAAIRVRGGRVEAIHWRWRGG